MHRPTLIPVERTDRGPRREEVINAGTGRAGGCAVGYGNFLWMAEGFLVVAAFRVWVEVEGLDGLSGRGGGFSHGWLGVGLIGFSLF